MTERPTLLHLRDAVLNLPEPAPATFLANRADYPWLVVGTVCIGAFIGQVTPALFS